MPFDGAPERKQSELERFAEWVAQQPARQEYEWCSFSSCALGQWQGGKTGSYMRACQRIGRRDGNFALSAAIEAARGLPRTFGALRKRLVPVVAIQKERQYAV
jgi:hypothetical protein